MGASGVDVLLSSRAKSLFPYSVECKNLARIAVYSYFDQCMDNCHPDTNGLLVIKQNQSEPLAVVSLKHFMELTQLAYQNRTKE
jgi:hypothetical protein